MEVWDVAVDGGDLSPRTMQHVSNGFHISRELLPWTGRLP